MQVKSISHPLEWLQSPRMTTLNLVKEKKTGTLERGWREYKMEHLLGKHPGDSLKS